ncbi:MAG: glycoside hydrolase family 32 protein [Ruminococcaceae bacterium]|nr:glycoside hydrolase family 32 protein [Oscillospiraceae bacterium]
MNLLNITTYRHRNLLMNDPYRPGYHFAAPGDYAYPGDPNGAFFADGVYHLMYLYYNHDTNAYHWGHQVSRDLLHWQQRPDALTSDDYDKGCYSGGAFLDEDGTAYLTFWKFPARDPAVDLSGIGMACSRPPYDHWERMNPIAINATRWGILDVEIDGKTVQLGCADPSNIWKADGMYYMQLGNLCVLNEYRRREDAPDFYRGNWTELFRSRDLKTWEFVHRFYDRPHIGEGDWPDASEDDMCPSFLPLYDAPIDGKPTGKWLQLFISHNKGCQYMVGTLENEKFLPEVHGRMTWRDKSFFAPEALVDDRGRQIMWTWLVDNIHDDLQRFGWSGVFSFPRVLWWQDDCLHMAPAQELEQLQHHHQCFTGTKTPDLPVKNGESVRIKTLWKPTEAACGLKVRCDGKNGEHTALYYDRAAGKLVMDTSASGAETKKICEEAPLTLADGEELALDVFIDHSVIEVYANDRQAICRRVYPTEPAAAMGVSLIGDPAAALQIDAWEIAPTNQF